MKIIQMRKDSKPTKESIRSELEAITYHSLLKFIYRDLQLEAVPGLKTKKAIVDHILNKVDTDTLARKLYGRSWWARNQRLAFGWASILGLTLGIAGFILQRKEGTSDRGFEIAPGDQAEETMVEPPPMTLDPPRTPPPYSLSRLQDLVERVINEIVNKNYSQALRYIDELLPRLEQSSGQKIYLRDMYYYKGLSYQGLDDHERALIWFDKALAIDPEMIKALVNKGVMLIRLQQYTEAEQYFLSLTSDYPDDMLAWDGLGEARFFQGKCLDLMGKHDDAIRKFQSAIEACKKAIGLDTLDFESQANLGMYFSYAGQHQAAIEALNKAITLNSDPDAQVFSDLGISYYYLQDHAQAKEAFEEALKRDRNNPEDWNSLAALLEILGDSSNAFRTLLECKRTTNDLKICSGKWEPRRTAKPAECSDWVMNFNE